MSIARLRNEYHRTICERLLSQLETISDCTKSGDLVSAAVVSALIVQLTLPRQKQQPATAAENRLFIEFTQVFLQKALALLQLVRPCKWQISRDGSLQFEQYEHLADLQRILHEKPKLRAALGGDYLITPDITIGRYPATDAEINQEALVVGDATSVCQYSPLRATNRPASSLILHASIFCKWTMRSDRAQNIRTEGLNLIRNRKGHLPHIVAVTAEPLPSRLASLALGTGDLDCVYHFALPELQMAVAKVGSSDQLEMLTAMVDGRRLRDISDLPLDLAV